MSRSPPACTANPFNADGATCQGGAIGTPFFLFTNGTSPLPLFADAYQPDAPVTGGGERGDRVDGDRLRLVNPQGAQGQRLVPVRDDDRLRAVDGSPDDGTRQRGGQRSPPR